MSPAKETLLSRLEELGKELARAADPTRYRLESAAQAAAFKPQLEAVRRAYRAVRDGAGDPKELLTGLRKEIPTGIERNKLDRILDLFG